MQLTPSICWCSEGLERFGEILTRREALLISTELKKRLFLKKAFFFFWSLLFFLMHFIWHYLILNRVSLSLTRSMDIKNCWNDSTLQQYSNIHLHIIFIQLNKHLNSMQLVYQSNLSCSILSSFSFCCCSCLLPVVVLLKEASISFGASVQCVIGSQMS